MLEITQRNAKLIKEVTEATQRNPLVAHADVLKPVPMLRHMPAESMQKRLMMQIVEFQEELDLDHEVGVQLAMAGTTTVIHIEDVGFHGTDLVIFYGRDLDGHRVRIAQHFSQVSVVMKTLPKLDEKPIRLGFLAD
jgi:hypothetical protein